MQKTLSARARAKINLYLHVTGRRDDGYHDLNSMVVFGDFIADDIVVTKSNIFSMDVMGPFAPHISSTPIEHNLLYKSVKAIEDFAHRSLPCHITLTKNIPIGAGLGGGSSDAAMTIKLLEDLYDIPIPPKEKNDILQSLGADVPVCYHQKPLCFSGVGDVLSPAPPIPDFYILLIWPNVYGNTATVFQQYKGAFSKPVTTPSSFSTFCEFIDFLKTTNNDLDKPAQELYPDIKSVLSFLQNQDGCSIARMTGSGSCVFGIFEDEQSCKDAHQNAQIHHDWWTSCGMIKS